MSRLSGSFPFPHCRQEKSVDAELYRFEKNDLAIQDLTKAIEYSPQASELYYNLGVAYENSGKDSLALFNYTKAIELYDLYAKAFISRGVLYSKMKNADLAGR